MISQCYLPPNTGKHSSAPLIPQPDTLALDLPITEEWKAELTIHNDLDQMTCEKIILCIHV